jgi:hypothetical protein
MKSFSRKFLRRRLKSGPVGSDDPIYEDLQDLGFLSSKDDQWIVNPYWSADGKEKVDPIQEYMMDFLDSPIACMLGYVLPEIKMPPSNLMEREKLKKYESFLMSRIMKARDQSVSSMG